MDDFSINFPDLTLPTEIRISLKENDIAIINNTIWIYVIKTICVIEIISNIKFKKQDIGGDFHNFNEKHTIMFTIFD